MLAMSEAARIEQRRKKHQEWRKSRWLKHKTDPDAVLEIRKGYLVRISRSTGSDTRETMYWFCFYVNFNPLSISIFLSIHFLLLVAGKDLKEVLLKRCQKIHVAYQDRISANEQLAKLKKSSTGEYRKLYLRLVYLNRTITDDEGIAKSLGKLFNLLI
jgi:hypothetical protein